MPPIPAELSLVPDLLAPQLPADPATLLPWGVVGLALLLAVGAALRLGRERAARRAAETRAANVGTQLGALHESMRESFIAFDRELRFLWANPAFEALTGYPLDEIRERPALDHIHPDDRPAIVAEWERLADGGSLTGQEYRIVRRDQTVRWCSGHWGPLRDERGRQIGYLGRELDITERKHAEEEMRRDTELLQVVVEVQQAITNAGLDRRSVMQEIGERCRELTRASGAIVDELVGDELVPRVEIGIAAPRLPIDKSLSGVAARTGELQQTADAQSDPRVAREVAVEMGVRSIVAVPLRHDHVTLGVLKVVSPEPNAFSDRDARALRLLAGLMGASLGHAAAFEARQSRLEERTQSLQESEQRFKQLVDAAYEGIWIADERGAITYANQRMVELLGRPTVDVLGRRIDDHAEMSSRTALQGLVGAAVRNGRERQEALFRRGDGSPLWGMVSVSPVVDREGRAVGTVGLLTDLTERKRAEDRLRRSVERLALLHDIDRAMVTAESPPEIAAAALARLRRLVPCQRAAVHLYNFDRREVEVLSVVSADLEPPPAPIPFGDLPGGVAGLGTATHVEDLRADPGASPYARTLLRQGVRSLLTVPLAAGGEPTGEIVLTSQSVGAFEPEHREVVAEVAPPLAVAIEQARGQDGRAREMAELDRQLAERGATIRALHAELDTLVHTVSHDLRAPLRHITGFAQVLLEEYAPRLDAAATHYIERIRDGGRKLASLIDDLTLLSRVARQDVVRRRADLVPIVEEVAAQARTTLNGRKVEWRIGTLPPVDCDPGLARLAIASLIDNALKFTRPREGAVIEVDGIEVEGQRGIAVRDNGVGFKMAQAGKLFGVFQRLHRPDEFEGNGIGLALVQRIAHKHGGRAWADGEPNAGATFYVTFGRGVRD